MSQKPPGDPAEPDALRKWDVAPELVDTALPFPETGKGRAKSWSEQVNGE